MTLDWNQIVSIVIVFIFGILLFIIQEWFRNIWKDNKLIRTVISELEHNKLHMGDTEDKLDKLKTKKIDDLRYVDIAKIYIINTYQTTFIAELLRSNVLYEIYNKDEISNIYTILKFISDEYNKGIFDEINPYRENNVTDRIRISEILESQLPLLFGYKIMMDGLLSTLKENNKWRLRRYNKCKQIYKKVAKK